MEKNKFEVGDRVEYFHGELGSITEDHGKIATVVGVDNDWPGDTQYVTVQFDDRANTVYRTAKNFKLVSTLPPPEKVRASILKTAIEAITKDRNNTYGPPSQDFTRTAALWTTQFGEKLKDGESFEAHDVALAMILLKLSRLTWSPDHMDNWVDIAGYAGCGAECVTEGEQPSEPSS